MMENIHMQVTGNILTITVNLAVAGRPSATGKTTVLATTNGNETVPGTNGVKIGINVYKK